MDDLQSTLGYSGRRGSKNLGEFGVEILLGLNAFGEDGILSLGTLSLSKDAKAFAASFCGDHRGAAEVVAVVTDEEGEGLQSRGLWSLVGVGKKNLVPEGV